ncbi:MAG: hypothetical protein CUN56_06505 [Phototrophicales bacterium]|nr:MAG: hypothetical protein CUN56_06505 [Phototrophicales bacterium]RMG74021.1 MAG: FkbM family methyltransferase [Chloroflexota bacterium]
MIEVYRKTLKRIRPVHVMLHHLMTAAFIPALERIKNFKTMPDDPFWFRLELLTNRHEQETVAQFKRLITPGMTVLDVGAHVGYYARLLSQLVGEEGRVIAFEPHPRTFDYLMKNVASLLNVTTVQVAVAEAEGTAELYDYLMMSASGSLHYDPTLVDLQKSHATKDDIAPRLAQGLPVQTYTVRTMPIDMVLDELDIACVDLVKMDIEGAEMGALRGMKRTIKQSPNLKLIMEYNPVALRAFDNQPEEALHEVLGMGFSHVSIIQKDGTLTDITGQQETIKTMTARLMDHMDVENLLFTK